MKYISILALSLMLLLVASCDRFEHSFQPESEHILILQLNNAFDQISADDMSALDALYSEDYLYNNTRKSQRMQWYRSFMGEAQLSFSASQIEYTKEDANNGALSWRVQVFSDGSVIADSSFVNEKVKRISGNRWELLGNLIAGGDETAEHLVIAEYFTFRTCPNCPPAEEKLSQLQARYPDNFIYLEHHVSMELALPGNTVPAYYSAWSQPAAVFQGQEKVNGSTPDKLAEYQSIVEAYLEQSPQIQYTLQETLENGDNISGRVKLKLSEGLDTTDLVLNYLVISDEHHYTNAIGQPLHNVVRALGSHSIANADLNQPQDFSLTVPGGSLPQAYTLVIYAQKRPATFNNNATIYGGITQKFTNSARRK